MTQRLTPTQWLICVIASIGFAFDIYELLMLPLIIKPAIAALSAPLVDGWCAAAWPRPQAAALWPPGGEMYVQWARTLFFVPAIAGGVFGLLGGYLTDLLGRRRVLTCSILLYALPAAPPGFATSLPQLLFFRCLVFIGVCVEFVAAVAWLAELFPKPNSARRCSATRRRSRRSAACWSPSRTCRRELATSPPGDPRRPRGLALHAHLGRHPGAAADPDPALPARVARLGAQARRRQLKRPSFAELFSPALRKTTI